MKVLSVAAEIFPFVKTGGSPMWRALCPTHC